MFEVNTKQLREAMIRDFKVGLVPMVASSPGMGKSDVVKSIADEFKLKLIDLRVSQCEPVDMKGFPDTKDDPTNSYNETWEVSLKDNEEAPTGNNKYSVHPSLYAEVADIIEREQEIKREKREMDKFLSNTFDRTTGSKQIREMWPESLHKYLPKEPERKKREKVSKEDLPIITAPSELKTRLVNNLLEEK